MFIMWVQSGLVGGVCLRVCGLGSGCSSVECAGGERCVDFQTQKEGKNSIPKGREAEVTSTVRERSHANNARLLCACQQKTSFSKPRTRVSTAFFVFLSVDANSIESKKSCCL